MPTTPRNCNNTRGKMEFFLEILSDIVRFLFFLLDVVLDIWAVVTFYQEEAYISMGVLIFVLVGSSVLVQAFSWLWYNYDSKLLSEEFEFLKKYRNRGLLGVLHVCQLGVFLRFASMMEISLRNRNLSSKDGQKEGIVVFLSNDLRLLRLIETFSESAPQLTLMMTIIVQREEVEWVTGLKTLGSFAAIISSVVMYHRATFKAKVKVKMTWMPSLVYFLWNFLLIAPRLAAVALAASTLPYGMIAVHFLLLWITFFLWAWWQKTDFMDTKTGEWLYRGTVALIWYFCWFNVSHYDCRGRGFMYRFIIAVDSAILLGLWWWDCAQASVFGISAWVVLVCVGSSYIVGIIVNVLYDKLCHPKRSAAKDKSDTDDSENILAPQKACLGGETPSMDEAGMDEAGIGPIKAPSPPPPPKSLTGAQKRMQRLADIF
ncbi:XK-related protein 8-like [Sardina pilchardus]|uniref:XK-related protein 8-like n=1 Tax=Sardina pilchardus TaxID=27697 RepID=UPI002E14BB4B